MKTTQSIPGTRFDRTTGQYFPTINGADASPSSFDESRALQIAADACNAEPATPNAEFIAELDSDEYDTEAAAMDDRHGNFSPENANDYLQTNIVLASLANGQFSQAKAQCSRYGFSYREMRRAAGLSVD